VGKLVSTWQPHANTANLWRGQALRRRASSSNERRAHHAPVLVLLLQPCHDCVAAELPEQLA
jgi:hypothetical protein